MLNKFSEAIRGNLTKQQRLKIVALVTIEVHARDILEKLVKAKVADASAFEWLSQLRVYWDREIDDCVVRQTNTQFQYGYEYLGNSGRLVITQLTDRWVSEKWSYQFCMSSCMAPENLPEKPVDLHFLEWNVKSSAWINTNFDGLEEDCGNYCWCTWINAVLLILINIFLFVHVLST